MSAESNSAALIIPWTKFEAIISKDVGGDALRQILDLDRYNFLPVVPIVMILVTPVQRAFQDCILLSPCDESFSSYTTVFRHVSRHPKFEWPPTPP